MAADIELRRHSPVRRLTGVRLVATGSYVPEQIVTNADLAALGFDEEWIVQRTGIRERRFAPPEMATSDVATEAARRCMEAADVKPADIDLVILGTYSADMPVPASACRVQDNLGISAAAFDVQAACAGFMYSLVTASQFVVAGTSQLALVMGADCNSRAINPDDKKTYPLFGDGGGAVLLSKGTDEQGLLAYTLGSDGAGRDLLCRPMGGSRIPPSQEAMARGDQYLYMNGRPVFKWAVRLLDETIHAVLDRAQLTLDDIDLFVMHQANRRILDAAAEAMDIDPHKVAINVDRYGNTSAGSIPLTLDEAHRAGRVGPGSRLCLSGFGAGLSWGTAIWQW
ncbi:MAG: beta-ketoacyl-ACP synthase III [Pirellulales bacterium]